MENFPSNSNAPRKRVPAKESAKKERTELTRVVSGNVTRRRRPLGKKITDLFTGVDLRDAVALSFFEVMLPAARDMLFDSGESTLRAMFYGDSSGPRNTSHVRGGPHGRRHVNYSRYSDPRGRRDEPREISRKARSGHMFDEILFDNRVEAEAVLDILIERIDEYGDATVADLYDLVDITENYTDKRYGWSSLATASVSRAKGGYILVLPRPEVLDR